MKLHMSQPCCGIIAFLALAAEVTAQAFYKTDTYSSVTHSVPTLPADVDGDGDLDLITHVGPTLHAKHRFGVWINDGDGRFTDETLSRMPTTDTWNVTPARLLDLDLDGDLDIVFAGMALPLSLRREVLYVWLNDGKGYFTDRSSTHAPATQFSFVDDLVIADFDGDRFADIAVATANDTLTPGLLCSIFMNNRRGGFTDETSLRIPSTRASRVMVADCDSDGDVDLLFLLFDRGPYSFLLNDGRGYFTQSQQSFGVNWSGFVVLKDFDGDRHIDALCLHGHFDNLWINDGKGRFRDESGRIPKPTGYTGTVGVVGDFNGDGFPDILGHVHADSGPTYPLHYNLMMNDGSGRFRLIEAVLPAKPLHSDDLGMAVDVDGDGDDDYLDMVRLFLQPGVVDVWKNLWREVHSKAPPKLGQPYGIDVYTGQAPAVVLPFLSLGRSRLPLAGIGTFRLDLATTVAIGAYPLDKPGGVQVPLPIPNDNTLVGLPLSTQAAVIDTKALRVTGFTNARTEKIEK